jgi:outer membrane protein OmpA-like peptidoglycan-associated protein
MSRATTHAGTREQAAEPGGGPSRPLQLSPMPAPQRARPETQAPTRSTGTAMTGLQRIQQTHGNRFVQRWLHGHVLQGKFTVSQPQDASELEADRVADHVLRMPDPSAFGSSGAGAGQAPRVQRMCTACEEEEKVQPKECHGGDTCSCDACAGGSEPGISAATDSHIGSLDGQGQPLPGAVRDYFEPRFGRDFSSVRIHTGTRAEQSASDLQARAFTISRHIVFGAGEYRPESESGRRLLAHELTHVVQQGSDGGEYRAQGANGSNGDGGGGTGASIGREALGGYGSNSLPLLGGDLVQRACGAAAIGTPAGCTPATDDPLGELVLFKVSCDELVNAAEEQKIIDFADSMTETDTVTVHGFASVDGDPAFNDNLSCARAQRAQSILLTHGISPSQIAIRKHGATSGPAPTRRSVVLELAAGVSRAPVPQLTAVVDVAPTAGSCGNVNFVIHWELSRNSERTNGGFVIQDLTITWDEVDCTGAAVPLGTFTSPLHYFEAWRVAPATTVSIPATDTFGRVPPFGNCTVATLSFDGVARYFDNVNALPAHMVASNPATAAGTLRSSLTDPQPALGTLVSRPVARNLTVHWDCCPCQSSPTVIDSHTP